MGSPFHSFILYPQVAEGAVENLLGEVAGMRPRQAAGVFLFGDFIPMAEVEGNLDQRCICNMERLRKLSDITIVLFSTVARPDGQNVFLLLRENNRYVIHMAT